MSDNSPAIYEVFDHQKLDLLIHLINETSQLENVLIFCRTKESLHALTADLNHAELDADSVHSGKKPELRDRTLAAFAAGETRILCTTEAVAQNLNIEGVQHIVYYESPEQPKYFAKNAETLAQLDGQLITIVSQSDSNWRKQMTKVFGAQLPLTQAESFSYDKQPKKLIHARPHSSNPKGTRKKPLQNKKPKLRKPGR